MKKYDYVLVGAGLYSGVIAYLAGQAGKSCLVLERRDHTGGNIYCEEIEEIHVHKYGAHIFHTSNKEVWQFVNSLAEFNRYTNSPIANYKGEIYNMPFNMNTFSKMWGIRTPEEAKTIIEEQRKAVPGEPKNLEEQAIKLVEKIFMKSWLRVIQKSSGDVTAKNSRHLLSNGFRSVLLMTTIISMTAIREFQSAVIMESSRRC